MAKRSTQLIKPLPGHDDKGFDWEKRAHEALEEVASKNQYIVSDMVIVALEAAGLGLDNYSALGGVFTRGAKAGLIVKTDEKKHSTRSKSHSAKTVWISLIYNQQDLSPEAKALSRLIINALIFNADTVKYASMIFHAGGLDQKMHKRAVREFRNMEDRYTANITHTMAEFEKSVRAPGVDNG